MGLSIVQRIIAGFVLMLLLLVLLGFISILKIRGINEGLSQVSDRATPLVIAVAGLKGALQDSNRWVLTYRTSEDATQLPQLASQFKAQQARFLAQSQEMARFNDVAEAGERFRQVDGATREFYGLADQVLSQHGQWIAALDRRHELELAFIRLEDTYQWAADLLLQQTASKRSMRNKAELITSGIARDLKNIRRADAKTDLNELEKVLAKDIEMARKRLERVLVPDDVRQRFVVNLDRMQELALGPQGLLATMRHAQQLAASLQTLNQQLDTSLVNSLALLDEMGKSAGSIASQSRIGADDAVSSASLWILIVSAISAAAALIIGYTTARSIQRPLQLIDRALDRMATGDMTRRIDYQSRCEFGSLTRSINTLADKTGELLSQINAGSRHLVEEASRAAEISERAMSRVQDQKSQTDQVAAAITELEVSATEVARSTDGTKREVDLADEEARAGRKQVATTRRITEQLAGAMEEAVGITHKLGEFSNNIGSILDVIRSIAEQTNLLALNAAIEAARAGDAGRGFAVVADEVRVLSRRTHDSTAEIQQMIEALQQTTRKAVGGMETSRQLAGTSVEDAEAANLSLGRINEAIGAISDMATQIAAAAEEQTSVTGEISRNTENIRHVSQALAAQAGEEAAQAAQLKSLTERLEQEIGRFRL